MKHRARIVLEWASIALFAAALLAPTLDSFLRPGARRDVELEARLPEPFPTIEPTLESLRAFPRGVEAWYGDALGLRDVLLHGDSLLRVGLFRVSPGEPLLVGRDGWIFPTLLGILDASQGRAQLTRSRLETWRRALESRRAFCAELGIEYLVALAPEKNSLYPERLPRGHESIGPGVQDQLVDWLAERSKLRLLDLRPALRIEKERDHGADFAYYPLGTHWTDRGGYAVHRVLVEAARTRFPALEPVPLETLHWELDPEQGDTWAHRLRLWGTLSQEARVLSEAQRDFDGTVEREGNAVHVQGLSPDRPSLLVFHDSFGERVRKLLARCFGRSTFVFEPSFDAARVSAERPDVVIELFAERRLLLELPPALPVGGADSTAAEFDASAETLFVLNPDDDSLPMRAVDGTQIGRASGALVIDHPEGDAGLTELDVPAFPAGRGGLVRIEVETEHTDRLDVLYRTSRLPRFHRGQVASAWMPTGRGVLYLRLDAVDLMGPLRLRWGVGAGRFVLRGGGGAPGLPLSPVDTGPLGWLCFLRG